MVYCKNNAWQWATVGLMTLGRDPYMHFSRAFFAKIPNDQFSCEYCPQKSLPCSRIDKIYTNINNFRNKMFGMLMQDIHTAIFSNKIYSTKTENTY